jgi:hypothetical protein
MSPYTNLLLCVLLVCFYLSEEDKEARGPLVGHWVDKLATLLLYYPPPHCALFSYHEITVATRLSGNV